MEKQANHRAFEIIASILAVAAMAGVTLVMIQEVSADRIPWWPYPAFALFAAVVFVAYGFVGRDRPNTLT